VNQVVGQIQGFKKIYIYGFPDDMVYLEVIAERCMWCMNIYLIWNKFTYHSPLWTIILHDRIKGLKNTNRYYKGAEEQSG